MKKKIIAVDNNPVILKLLSTFLEQEGHQVITAQNGLFAVDILKTFVPDIMFVDLIMPNLSGDKLCQLIRTYPQYKNIYIIIFSGIAAEDELVCDVTEFGANVCLAKGPFASLKEDIRSLIEHAGDEKKRESSNKVIGGTRLFKREITQELLDVKKHADVMRDNLFDAVFELTADGLIVYANLKAAQLMGEQEKQLLAKNFFELFPERFISQVKSLFEISLHDKSAEKSSVPVVLNGKEVSLRFFPIESAAVFSVMVIAHDDSQSRKDILVLENAVHFAAVERMFVNQYIGGVGHAIAMIAGKFVDVCAKIGVGDRNQGTEQLEVIEQGSETAIVLKEVAREMAEFAKLILAPREQQSTPFDMKKVFSEHMVFLVTEARQKDINLLIDLPDLKSVELLGSPEGLSRVVAGLTSMVLNLSDKGELVVKCETAGEQHSDSIKFLFTINNKALSFPVISKNIFDFILPANLLSGHYPPNIGEELVGYLHEVRDMGGEIWVEEIMGQGPTIFFTAYFDVCLGDEDQWSFGQISEPSSPLFSEKMSILFLDDDLFTCEFLMNTIEKLTDWQVVVIDEFSELHVAMADTAFDLVFINVNMRGLEIAEVAKMITTDLKPLGVPVIALTENTHDEQEQFIEAGFDDCISKPVDLDEFFSVIEGHFSEPS